MCVLFCGELNLTLFLLFGSDKYVSIDSESIKNESTEILSYFLLLNESISEKLLSSKEYLLISLILSDELLLILSDEISVDSDKLFGSDYSDESLDIYSINQNLLDQNFSQLSEQFFIKGFPE